MQCLTSTSAERDAKGYKRLNPNPIMFKKKDEQFYTIYCPVEGHLHVVFSFAEGLKFNFKFQASQI